jgi:phospholipase/lecithinase/hemolysin
MKPFLASPTIKGAGAIDFAYGGTGTAYLDQTPGGMWAPGLKGQIELFRLALHGKKPSDRALYAIATGSNDYRDDPFNVPMSPADVVRNIEQGIVTLYRLGARDVMVLDIPDLGLIPANAANPNPEVAKAASAISNAHNIKLNEMLVALQARLPTLHLISVKLDPLFYKLLGTMSPVPALAWASSPETAACLFVAPRHCPDVDTKYFNMPLGFLFWDVVHPTTEAHHYLADYLYEQLLQSYD